MGQSSVFSYSSVCQLSTIGRNNVGQTNKGKTSFISKNSAGQSSRYLTWQCGTKKGWTVHRYQCKQCGTVPVFFDNVGRNSVGQFSVIR